MNLYSLHDKPEDLHKRKEADDKVPSVIWDKYPHNAEKLKPFEDILAKDPRTAYSYAYWILRSPFPKGEEVIAKSKFAYDYWRNVINPKAKKEKRFPAGEQMIAKNKTHAVQYTLQTNQGLPEFEATLIDDPKKVAAYIDVFPFRKEAMEKYLK